MITEDYVSFETAKLLKVKGFDGEYNSYYDEFGLVCSTIEPKFANLEHYKRYSLNVAMKWLREVHNLFIEPYVVKNYSKKKLEYTYSIQDLDFQGSDDGIECCKNWDTPERACEAAIKYCLEHLI